MPDPEEGRRVVVVWLDMDTAKEFVPLSVAEDLAEVLATIAADTHDHETAESGRAWRVKLAHETELAFRAAYPPADQRRKEGT